MPEPFKFGPTGGAGGGYWEDDTNGVKKISKVVIFSAHDIQTIQVTVEKGDGTPVDHPKRGSSSIGNEGKLSLSSNEYINAISGKYWGTISTIAFHTNTRGEVNTFGITNPDHRDYEYRAPDGYHIIGLFGSSGVLLDALGVKIAKIPS